MDDEVYLDPQHSMGHLCRSSFRDFSRALEKKTIEHGVTGGQWRYLRVLWEQNGISQRELSDFVGATEPTTVRSIRSLAKSGLVTRQRDAEDCRKFKILLTEKSKRLRATLMPFVIEINKQAVAGISKKDVETARKVLIQMQKNLNP